MNMVKLLTRLICLATLASAGCSYFTPHRIDIQQGNKLPAAAVEQVKPGMTSRQVRYLLGSPLAQAPFHPNRWDYLYWLKTGEGQLEHRQLTVFFEADQVVRITGYKQGEPGADD